MNSLSQERKAFESSAQVARTGGGDLGFLPERDGLDSAEFLCGLWVSSRTLVTVPAGPVLEASEADRLSAHYSETCVLERRNKVPASNLQ